MEKEGNEIRKARLEKGFTQRALAEMINVSDKTVSKWERNLGLPDVATLPKLSRVLGISISSIIGEETEKKMKKTCFYYCPICHSVASSQGEMEISCCGKRLVALKEEKAKEEEKLMLEDVEDEIHITSGYPQTKEDHIAFIAFVNGERTELIRTYPEWDISVRIKKRRGYLFFFRTNGKLCYQLI